MLFIMTSWVTYTPFQLTIIYTLINLVIIPGFDCYHNPGIPLRLIQFGLNVGHRPVEPTEVTIKRSLSRDVQ